MGVPIDLGTEAGRIALQGFFAEADAALSYLGEDERTQLRLDEALLQANRDIGISLMFASGADRARFYATEEGAKYAAALKGSNEAWDKAYAGAAYQNQQNELLQARLDEERESQERDRKARKARFAVLEGGKKQPAPDSSLISITTPEQKKKIA